MIVITFIRSLIFTTVFYITFIPLSVILSAIYLTGNEKAVIWMAREWNHFNIELLRFICGVKYRVNIDEGFDENQTYLILMKHESTWETYFLFQYFKKTPAPVAKKELFYIPIFGQMLAAAGTIYIDRGAGMASVKKMIKEAQYYITKKHRSIMLAPQGTRVPVGGDVKDYPYKSGFISIAETCNVPILPVALNSGKCWPKGSFLKYPGTIQVDILKPISIEEIKSLSKTELVKLVADRIETRRKMMD